MEYELYHYGVKGMKWGIRRYQNADGSLTAEGRKRAIREYRNDNDTAYELGKSATITGHAAAKSMNRTIKIENKLNKQYEKDPDGTKNRTKKLNEKWQASSKTTKQLVEQYTKLKSKAEEHCKSLVDKYGDVAVSGIKYKDVKVRKGENSPSSFNTMAEKTNNASDYAKAGAKTIMTNALANIMGLPITMIYVPSSTGDKARQVEYTTYRENRENLKRGK